jgi:cytochrome oxidase Cu insertion factor (SCO1/SenC/PrrC family)
MEMNWLKNPRPQGVLGVAMLALALVGGMSQGGLLHAASLEKSMTALGLTTVLVEFAAPELRLPDVQGTVVILQEYRGKVVMLYFWTTW